MKKFIESLLKADKGTLSSKRLCGVSGFIVTLIVYVYCTVTGKQSPDMTDPLLITVTTLLGVDSVTGIFKHKGKDDV